LFHKFTLDIANNKISHEFGIGDRGKTVGAYAIIFRKDGEPTIEWADFATYNKGYNTWKTNPDEMIKKVAESHGLKKAFGISGIQSEYDFEVKDNVAIPIQLDTKSVYDIRKKFLIELVDKLPEAKKEAHKKILREKESNNELNLAEIESMIEQLS